MRAVRSLDRLSPRCRFKRTSRFQMVAYIGLEYKNCGGLHPFGRKETDKVTARLVPFYSGCFKALEPKYETL